MRFLAVFFSVVVCVPNPSTCQPLSDAVSAEPSHERATRALRLDRLHDPHSTFYLRLKIEPWASAFIGTPLHRAWARYQERNPVQSLGDIVDSRALAIVRLLVHPGVTQAAFSAWPATPVGGVPRPMWMLGVSSDFEEEIHLLLERFIDWGNLNDQAIERTDPQGLGVLSVGGVHVVVASNSLVFSSDLRVLGEYLDRQPDADPVPDWPEADAEGFWRPPRLPAVTTPGERTVDRALQNLGIVEVHFACNALNPGIELRLAPTGITAPSIPSATPNLDFELLREVPADSDFLIVGGAFPLSATASNLLNGGWGGITDPFAQPFALGVDLPSASPEKKERLQVGGAARKIWGGDSNSTLDLDSDPHPGTNTTLQWGELELEVEETEDTWRFSNADRKVSDDLKDIPLNEQELRKNSRSLAFAFVSPDLIVRPYDDYFRENVQSKSVGSKLIGLWAFGRPFVLPLEISLNLEPGFLFEVVLRSDSVLSPFLFIAAGPSYLALLNR